MIYVRSDTHQKTTALMVAAMATDFLVVLEMAANHHRGDNVNKVSNASLLRALARFEWVNTGFSSENHSDSVPYRILGSYLSHAVG